MQRCTGAYSKWQVYSLAVLDMLIGMFWLSIYFRILIAYHLLPQ